MRRIQHGKRSRHTEFTERHYLSEESARSHSEDEVWQLKWKWKLHTH